MAEETLTLNVPERMYHRLKLRAEVEHRSLEEAALAALAASVPDDAAIPPAWEELLASMTILTNETFWQAAHNEVGRKAHTEIRCLGVKRLPRPIATIIVWLAS